MEFSRAIGAFRLDRALLALLLLAALGTAGRAWLHDHPQHNPWAPLNLNHPEGWATQRKLASLRSDPAECRAVLERSGVEFASLDPAGEGACRRENRVVLAEAPLSPAQPETSCATAAALEYWLKHGVRPAAQDIFGSSIARIEHLGTYSCRRLYGRDTGRWSEHASGNAIDVSAFVLEDGQRISILSDWSGEGDEVAFLRRARNSACDAFATVLSPDYNEAHADHLHLDQQGRMWGVCS